MVSRILLSENAGSKEEQEAIPSDEEVPVNPPSLYIKTDISLEKPLKINPQRKGDVLHGVELTVSGLSSYLYLLPESGVQKWNMDGQEAHMYVVRINNQVQPTPGKIHRRDFFTRKTVRRTLRSNTVKDTAYQINRELKFNEWQTFLINKLEESFTRTLDTHIF